VLWIALHLPLLSLESFAATLHHALDGKAGDMPLALLDVQGIASANAAAQALGVRPGLKRATALALAPQLLLGQADAARDAQCLLAVAHAALAFTPSVTIAPASAADTSPHTVLLEVQASLRYFGGLQVLLRRLHATLAPLGHLVRTVSAPTAQGAALLARVHRQLHCADRPAMAAALDAAPVWLLGPGREHWEALQGMGLRTLADLRRLPRAGLARRFGEALLDELDRARGERPDPREYLELPPSFDSRLELFARADSTGQVLHGAQMLLQRMVVWLVARHAFVRRFVLLMLHEGRQCSEVETPRETRLEIALAEPSRDAVHLQVLLRERLAQVQLPAPTLDLQLLASDVVQRAAPNGELFPTPGSEREGLTRLIERLQARLGTGQVQQLVPVEDHRPERGSQARGAGPPVRARPTAALVKGRSPRAVGPAALAALRPVLLLEPPESLHECQSRPLLDGQPLQLLSGPERIEAGWWDAGLVERDYFIAQTPEGALVWIYRARLPFSTAGDAPGWFLHGRFA
jgi:protein ImuB